MFAIHTSAADQNSVPDDMKNLRHGFVVTHRIPNGVGRTERVNVAGSGGTAWHCQQDGCGAHDAGLPREAATAITYSTAADRQWDATHELGIRTTAATPAIAMKAPIAPASPCLWRQPAQRRGSMYGNFGLIFCTVASLRRDHLGRHWAERHSSLCSGAPSQLCRSARWRNDQAI